MSLQVGLGASQDDLDIQGEIDFDFFEESDTASSEKTNYSDQHLQENKADEILTSVRTVNESNCKELSKLDSSKILYNSNSCEVVNESYSTCEKPLTDDVPNMNSKSSANVQKPIITVSYSTDNGTGAIPKTIIETVIPSPQNYTENKCGKPSNPDYNRHERRTHSPKIGSFISQNIDDKDALDDSSGGSMSSSMSDSDAISSLSDDSFEAFNESDSMTDVSPLPSPYNCDTPVATSEQQDSYSIICDAEMKDEWVKEGLEGKKVLPGASYQKKDGVKFSDDVQCDFTYEKDSVDLNALLKAIKRLEVEQNANEACHSKCEASLLRNNGKCRKNLSFSNEEVRRIDQENQRLLKRIVAQQNRSKPKSGSANPILPSSAVNRQRQQRQIQLENLALLKRLESAKPSRDLSRNHLLREYDRRSSVSSSSRSSTRPPSASRSSSQLSSCKSSAHSSGRSSLLSVQSSSKSGMLSHPSLITAKPKRSEVLSASRRSDWPQ